MKYIERIIISSDEVLHYPWLDYTDITIYLNKCDNVNNSNFKKIIYLLLSNRIKRPLNVSSKIIDYGTSLTIRINDIANNSKITELLSKSCDNLINNKVKFSENSPMAEKVYNDNYSLIIDFLKEVKQFIIEKEIKYYSQSVDGFN